MMFNPYFTFYTPTFRRPQALARCMASVAAQTIVDKIEQVIIPDHVGLGVGGMYKRVALYAKAVHGRYVHILADDDVLVSRLVCEQVREFAVSNCEPEMVIVKSKKGNVYPTGVPWPPVCGHFDLGCMVVRNDVWQRHVQAYGQPGRYEGDFDFATAVWAAGHKTEFLDLLFVEGAVSRGAEEATA
jgi:hypothetical protein